MNRKHRQALLTAGALLLLFGAALAMRVFQLQSIPPGLFIDEAANGLDALEVLAGRHSPFYERNSGREAGLIYLQSLAFLLLGPTPYAIRLASAIVGALTIPAIYWMVSEAFRRVDLPARALALWTALFFAFSYWHISMSRIGFRAILLPLMAALAFGFFWRAWNRLAAEDKTPWIDLFACGAFLGLSLYTYSPARLLPVWLALTSLFGAIQAHKTLGWPRLAGAFCIITGVAVLVFVPLGLYFLSHPDQFYGRAMHVSVLNPSFVGDTSPVQALWTSVSETARMFVDRADPNLRHNPAQRPVFNLIMASWLLAGIIISLLRIRTLPYFFAVTGFFLFALPPMISAEGIPHSLRAIGMLPPAYLLATIAMVCAGIWLAPRIRFGKQLAVWLPLPFFLLSATFDTYAYFDAFQNENRFRAPFLADYQLIDMAGYGTADGVWLWPLSPNYAPPEGYVYTWDFLNRGESEYGFALLDQETISAAVAEIVDDSTEAYLVRTEKMPDIFAASYVMGDPKQLITFLMEKHAFSQASFDADETESRIPLTQYRLPETSNYAVYEAIQPADVSFADRVKLTGFDLGPAAVAAEGFGRAKSSDHVAAGERLWIVLDWEALSAVDVDLKTSLLLKDDAGNLAGQIDNLLVSDLYPYERVWQPGEQTLSYHILPIWPGVSPGTYDLHLRVYESDTGQTYPIVDETGSPIDREWLIGSIVVDPAVIPQEVTPSQLPEGELAIGESVVLTGFDLPKTVIAPGEDLPLTLYWRASDVPAENSSIELMLVDEEMNSVAQSTVQIGDEEYPVTAWRQDEVIRDWKRLPVDADTPVGVYQLLVSAISEVEGSTPISLGNIEVQGLAKVFDVTEITSPTHVRFDQTIDLLGADAPGNLTVEPGGTAVFDLIWQVGDPPDGSLVRFVHLLDDSGQPIAQQDTVPCNGACPSDLWAQGEVLTDPVSLALPESLSPGHYSMVVGWYDSDTFQRVPILDEDGMARPDGLATLPVFLQVE